MLLYFYTQKLSGFGSPKVIHGTKLVPDLYSNRDSLSGNHAGLLTTGNPCAPVIAADTPLRPKTRLDKLMESHRHGITVVQCEGEPEPLIGVYAKALFDACEDILRGAKTSVRRRMTETGFEIPECTGDSALLMNGSTPEENQKMRSNAKKR